MLHNVVAANPVDFAKQKALEALAAPNPCSLSISPILHPQAGVPNPVSRTFWSATANALYLTRRSGGDLFGATPDHSEKLAVGNDVVDHGRRGPIGCAADNVAGLKLWQAADQATQADRPSAPAAFHIIGWFPTNTSPEAWRDLLLAFLDREIVANGMIADWAIHSLPGDAGAWIKPPHFHAILTHRFWKAGRRTGEPNHAWLGSAKQRQKMEDAWHAAASPE